MRPERPGLRPKNLDLRPEKPNLRPERLDLRPERLDLTQLKSFGKKNDYNRSLVPYSYSCRREELMEKMTTDNSSRLLSSKTSA